MVETTGYSSLSAFLIMGMINGVFKVNFTGDDLRRSNTISDIFSIIYLQMLCVAGMLYPLHALNLNMLNVQGRSDLFLKLEIILKALAIPVIIIGVLFGIRIMIIGMIFNSFAAYYLNSYWSGKFIGYSMKKQVKDITPSFLLAAGMVIAVFIMVYFLKTSPLVTLILQVILRAVLFFGFCELTKMTDYIYMKQIVLKSVFKRNLYLII